MASLPLVSRHVAAFHLDTNRINARQRLAEINQLEEWDRRDVITLELSVVARDEILRTASPLHERKAYRFLATETLADTSQERQLLREIAVVLFPKGLKDQNDRNDVEIVFNAHKYAAHLVTADGVILGRAAELRGLNIRVFDAHNAVAFVRSRIELRDRSARFRHEKLGHPLPDWVGRD
jgi:hypothetical protein